MKEPSVVKLGPT